MQPVFEVFKDWKGNWKFQLRAGNGKVIALSRDYSSKRNVILAIESVQDCAPDAVILYKDN